MPELELLERRIRWTGAQQLVMALFCVGFGLYALANAVHTHRLGPAVFALICIALGWVVSPRRNWPPRRSKLYRAVSEHPEEIVWFYETRGRTVGVTVHFRDARAAHVWANRNDARTLFEFIRARAPQAIAGHGPAQVANYAAWKKQLQA